jgi:hypothetical protein
LVSARRLKGRVLRRAPASQFITTVGNEFHLNGRCVDIILICGRETHDDRIIESRPFKFVGTNAYWIPTLNSPQDISDVFANISAAGIKVVRVWAFNGVILNIILV